MKFFCTFKAILKRKKNNPCKGGYDKIFEAQLAYFSQAIHKKGCTKRYDKVLERLGRLKKKYQQIARFYQIEVEVNNGLGLPTLNGII
jgi:hypothetical protein